MAPETYEVFCFGNTLIADEGSPLSAYLKAQKGKRIRITIPQMDIMAGGHKPLKKEPDGYPFITDDDVVKPFIFDEKNEVPF